MPRKPRDKFVERTLPNGRVVRDYTQVSEETFYRVFAPQGPPVGLSVSSTRRETEPAAPAADSDPRPEDQTPAATPRPASDGD